MGAVVECQDHAVRAAGQFLVTCCQNCRRVACVDPLYDPPGLARGEADDRSGTGAAFVDWRDGYAILGEHGEVSTGPAASLRHRGAPVFSVNSGKTAGEPQGSTHHRAGTHACRAETPVALYALALACGKLCLGQPPLRAQRLALLSLSTIEYQVVLLIAEAGGGTRMAGEGSQFAQSESFCGIPTGAQVLDVLQARFRSLGATHFLASGMPFPGRPIEPLLLRLRWGDLSADGRTGIRDNDPILQHTFRAHRPSVWRETYDPMIAGDSTLLNQLGPPGHRQLVLVPICSFLPYQGVVVGGGHNLAIDAAAAFVVDHLCIAAFRRLFRLGYLRPERPGELSGRERKVVELSAAGMTAGEIAAILKISQRTVHAHLQNASEKLHAHNKTHTVVEALRYGQISV